MSDSVEVLLQKALVTALTSDVRLGALLTKDSDGNLPIYDTVSAALMKAASEGNLTTYIIIGQGTETWDDAGDAGYFSEITKHEPTIAAFSQSGGFAAVKNIIAAARCAIMTAYETKTFSIDDHQITAFDLVRATYSRSELDGITSIGALTMRISTTPLT